MRNTNLTEEQIESRVEKMMDHLDRIFMAGEMSQKNYDNAIADLRHWADVQYRKIENQRIYNLYSKHH